MTHTIILTMITNNNNTTVIFINNNNNINTNNWIIIIISIVNTNTIWILGIISLIILSSRCQSLIISLINIVIDTHGCHTLQLLSLMHYSPLLLAGHWYYFISYAIFIVIAITTFHYAILSLVATHISLIYYITIINTHYTLLLRHYVITDTPSFISLLPQDTLLTPIIITSLRWLPHYHCHLLLTLLRHTLLSLLLCHIYYYAYHY